MMSRDGCTASEKALMQLSRETLEGLHITGEKSRTPIYICYCTYYFTFTSVTRYLMSFPEVKGHYLPSERFSQDPIENYFRQQCSHGGRCDNPTVDALFTAAQSLRVQGSQAMLPVRGNSSHKRRLIPQETIDGIPLPKRPRLKMN